MKLPRACLILATGLFATCALGQGTFVYDQQSSDESYFGSGAGDIQSNQPIGQSFTPSFSGISFIRLHLSDNAFNSLGTTIYVNLRENSITGNVLAATSPVLLADRFSGPVNFFFATNVSVNPQVPYYFQPVVQTGESFSVALYNTFGYSGGVAISKGLALPGSDLWFREGLYVPEPASAALGLLGAVCLAWARRRRFPNP